MGPWQPFPQTWSHVELPSGSKWVASRFACPSQQNPLFLQTLICCGTTAGAHCLQSFGADHLDLRSLQPVPRSGVRIAFPSKYGETVSQAMPCMCFRVACLLYTSGDAAIDEGPLGVTLSIEL